MRGLVEAAKAREVVRLVRKPARKLDRVYGFVVGHTDELVLLHEVHPDLFTLNGYCCVRIADIKYGEVVGGADQFIGRGVHLNGLEPVLPDGLDLSSMSSLLRTAGELFPLLVVHTEHSRLDVCYIGPVLKVGRKYVFLQTIDSDALWDTREKYAVERITMVEFDSGYERMLWRVNQTYQTVLPTGASGLRVE
jgi:hypothetical protein